MDLVKPVKATSNILYYCRSKAVLLILLLMFSSFGVSFCTVFTSICLHDFSLVKVAGWPPFGEGGARWPGG